MSWCAQVFGFRVPWHDPCWQQCLARRWKNTWKVEPLQEAALITLSSVRLWCSLDFCTPPTQTFPHFLLQNSATAPMVDTLIIVLPPKKKITTHSRPTVATGSSTEACVISKPWAELPKAWRAHCWARGAHRPHTDTKLQGWQSSGRRARGEPYLTFDHVFQTNNKSLPSVTNTKTWKNQFSFGLTIPALWSPLDWRSLVTR